MPDPTDDFARSIAENIGLMPMVTKAGEAGSGFINFLGSLLGGGAGPAQAAQKPQAPARVPAKTQAQAAEPGFFPGLWDSITSGAKSSVDALRDDWGNIQEGQLPKHLGNDLGTALMMMGRGGFGPGMGKVPATRTVQRTFDPAEGWKEVGEVITPSVDPLKSLGLGNVFGSTFSDILLKLLNQTRKNAAGIPQ